MKMFLVRHPAVVVDEGTCYGHLDVELKEHPQVCAQRITNKVGESPMVFTSPLQRCAKVAEHLGSQQTEVDERLKEMHFGNWEGKLWSEIPREESDLWATNYVAQNVPSGESFQQLLDRTENFLNTTIKSLGKDCLLLTHGGVIRAFLVHLMGLDPLKCFRLKIDYESITTVEFIENCIYINGVNR